MRQEGTPKPKTARILKQISELMAQNPEHTPASIAAELHLSKRQVANLCYKYPQQSGYGERISAAQKVQGKIDKLEAAIKEDPKKTLLQLENETGISSGAIFRWVDKHPEWGWIGHGRNKKRKEPKAKKKSTESSGNYSGRLHPPTKTELACAEISRKAVKAGFHSWDYGAYMVFTHYQG